MEWSQVDVKDGKEGGPGARSSHGISVINRTLYVFGGEKEPRIPVDSLMWSASLDNDSTWSVCKVVGGDPPPLRLAHTQTSHGDWIYVFGGRQGITMEELPLNDFHRFNVKSGIWETIVGEPTAEARSFHRMVQAGPFTFFVFGGCSASGRLADLHRIDLDKNGSPTATWTQLATPKIKGRGGAGFCLSADTNRLFVIGGFTGEESADIHVYTIADATWTTISSDESVFRPRSVCATATLSNGKFFFFGGEVSPSDHGHEGAGGFEKDVLLFNDTTGAVTTITPKGITQPPARGWSAATPLGDDGVVMYGGLAGSDEAPQRLGDVWVLKQC